MYITVICHYCDNRWEQYLYSTGGTGKFKCDRCKETKALIVLKDAAESVDYYIGSPDFPVEEKHKEDKELDSSSETELVSNNEDFHFTSD